MLEKGEQSDIILEKMTKQTALKNFILVHSYIDVHAVPLLSTSTLSDFRWQHVSSTIAGYMKHMFSVEICVICI